MSFLSALATVFGAVGGLAVFPQVYKIFRRKSAKDISVLTYSFLFVTAIIWALYGLEINNIPVMTTNVLGVINFGLVIVGWLLYGKSK